MTDLATLGLEVESSQAVGATRALEGLKRAAVPTETAIRAMEASASRLGITMQEMQAKVAAAQDRLGRFSPVVQAVNRDFSRMQQVSGLAAGAASNLNLIFS